MTIRIYILAIVTTASMFAACKDREAEVPESRTASTPDMVTLSKTQMQTGDIQTGMITRTAMRSQIQLSGVVDVPPQNMISVSFPIAAFLKSTSLLPGVHVSRGQTIAVMEDAALIQLQQDYLVAQSKLRYAELDFKRQQQLNETKTTSDKVFQQASAEYETQRVLVTSLAEKLRLIGIDPSRLTESTISRKVAVHSPINGFVSSVHVNIGKYVQPSEVMFELIDPGDLHAALTVFESDITSIKQGQKVQLNFVDQPGKTYQSTVFLVTRNVDANRAGIIHCHFDDQPSGLRPGMFLNALLTTSDSLADAVPEDAVVRYDNKEYIFVNSEADNYVLTEVTTGKRVNGLIELRNTANRFDGKSIITKNAFMALSKLKNVSDE